MPKGKGPTWEGWAGYPRTSGRLVPRANPTAGLKPGLGAWKPAFPSARGSPGLFPNCPVRAWTRTAQEAQGAHCADSPSWGLGVRCRLSALPARLGTGCGVSRQGAGPRSPLPRGRTAHARPPSRPARAANGPSGRDRPPAPQWAALGPVSPGAPTPPPPQPGRPPSAGLGAPGEQEAGQSPRKPPALRLDPRARLGESLDADSAGRRGGHHVPAPSAHVACLSDSTPRLRSGLSPRAGLAGGQGSEGAAEKGAQHPYGRELGGSYC